MLALSAPSNSSIRDLCFRDYIIYSEASWNKIVGQLYMQERVTHLPPGPPQKLQTWRNMAGFFFFESRISSGASYFFETHRIVIPFSYKQFVSGDCPRSELRIASLHMTTPLPNLYRPSKRPVVCIAPFSLQRLSGYFTRLCSPFGWE